MVKERKIVWVFVVIISIVLLFIILNKILTYTPYYDSTVTEYSDKAPRVGNNIYGYIDVPEGFVMAGSFDGQNDDYAGGKDGIKEGVRLYDPEGTACITISLLTSDKRQENYLGISFEKCITFNKRTNLTNNMFDAVSVGILEDLLNSDELLVRTDVDGNPSQMDGSFIETNGLSGMAYQWDSVESGQRYHNQMNIFEDPEKKNTIHCVTITYKPGYICYLDNLYSFSLSSNKQDKFKAADSSYMGMGKRVGNKDTGYMNIPEGYDEIRGWALVEWKDNKDKDCSFSFFADKEKINNDAPVDKGMVIGSFTKSNTYDHDVMFYMKTNFEEVFGNFMVREYFDLSNVSLDKEDSEFGAKAFVKVMEQCLREGGEFEHYPVDLNGQQGYKVTWAGRNSYNNQRTYFSFYILDGADGGTVYIAGARDEENEGRFWKCLDTFSVEK